MQEWMIAMLVISIMLIIRDMAKTILAENLPDTQELLTLQEGHPQKERVEKYAASFQIWQILFMECHIAEIT